MKFQFQSTQFPGLLVIDIPVYSDHRGWLTKIFEATPWKEYIPLDFKESYVSFSRPSVFRGLHFQNPPQGKLIVPIEGEFVDFAIDLRKNSPTFGKVHGIKLTRGRAIYVPRGMAHGMLALTEVLYVAYQTEEYIPGGEGGVNWKSVESFVRDYIDELPIISDKDANLPPLSEVLQSSAFDIGMYPY